MASYRERVVTFGRDHGLVGIVTLPTTPTWTNGATPFVVLLNSGIVHRVGASRLYVRLTRALASAGLPTLRFDLSGLGDSEPRRGVQSLREAVERDIDDAFQYVTDAHGVARFVLVGLCSGAYDALYKSTTSESVLGAVLIDIPGPFRTWRHHVRHFFLRIVRPDSWRHPTLKLARSARAMNGAVKRSLLACRHAFAKLAGAGATSDDTSPDRHPELTGWDRAPLPPSSSGQNLGMRSVGTHEKMHAAFESALERGVKLYVVFTAGNPHQYNHPARFRTTFPDIYSHPHVSYQYLAAADHVFTAEAQQLELTRRLIGWIEQGEFVRADDSGGSDETEQLVL